MLVNSTAIVEGWSGRGEWNGDWEGIPYRYHTGTGIF